MFEDIEALEKEVQGFRDNILASSELVTSLDRLTAEIKAHAGAFHSASKELLAKIDEQTHVLQRSAESTFSAHIVQLTTSNQAQISAAVEKITVSQKAYADRMDAAEEALKKREKALNSKYESILAKLESANLEETVRLCRKIEKSINTKFGILLVGIGASVVLAVLVFLLK